MLGWQNNPVDFIRGPLGADPWNLQCDIVESVRDNSRTAVRSCNGIGKDWLAARICWWWLLCHHEAAVITSAPSWHQIKDITWREIRSAWAQAPYRLSTSPPNNVEVSLSERRFALGISTDRKERFQGIHNSNILIIVTEASGMPDDILDAIDTLCAGGQARILYLGNPTRGEGGFYEAWHDDATLYQTFKIPAWDTPNFTPVHADTNVRPYLINPQWVDERRIKWGEGSTLWKVHVEADFPDQDDSFLFPLDILEAAVDREIPASVGPVLSLGVDVARGGSSRTVYTVMRGGLILDQIETKGGPVTGTAQGAIDLDSEYTNQLRIAVDDNGVGGGVVDILIDAGYDVIPVMVGSGAKDPKRFANKGSELFWSLREAFYAGTVNIPSTLDTTDRLIEQLNGIRYELDSKERIIVRKKARSERSKNVSGESPDLADSLMLSFAAQSEDELNDYFMA